MRRIDLTNEIRSGLDIQAWIEVDVYGSDVNYTGYVQVDGQPAEYCGMSAYQNQIAMAVNERASDLVIELSADGFAAQADGVAISKGCQSCGDLVEDPQHDSFCAQCWTNLREQKAPRPCTCPLCAPDTHVGPIIDGLYLCKISGQTTEYRDNQPVCDRCGGRGQVVIAGGIDHRGKGVWQYGSCPECQTPSLPLRPSFREKAQQAIAEAREKCLDKARWLVAVEKAAEELETGNWVLQKEMLRIQSRTQSGVVYRVDEFGCSCRAFETGKPCWHRAAWRILVKANA